MIKSILWSRQDVIFTFFFVTFYDFTKWIENGCYIMSYFFESILLQIKSNLILVDGNIIIVDEKVQND